MKRGLSFLLFGLSLFVSSLLFSSNVSATSFLDGKFSTIDEPLVVTCGANSYNYSDIIFKARTDLSVYSGNNAQQISQRQSFIDANDNAIDNGVWGAFARYPDMSYQWHIDNDQQFVSLFTFEDPTNFYFTNPKQNNYMLPMTSPINSLWGIRCNGDNIAVSFPNPSPNAVFWFENSLGRINIPYFISGDYTVTFPDGYEGDTTIPNQPLKAKEVVKPIIRDVQYQSGVLSFVSGENNVPLNSDVSGLRILFEQAVLDSDNNCTYNETFLDLDFNSNISLSAPYNQGDYSDCVSSSPSSNWRPYRVSVYFSENDYLLGSNNDEDDNYIYEIYKLELSPTDKTWIIGGGYECVSGAGVDCQIFGEVQVCVPSGFLSFGCPVIEVFNESPTAQLVGIFVPFFSGFYVDSLRNCPLIYVPPNPDVMGHDFDISMLPEELCKGSKVMRDNFPILMLVSNFIVGVILIGLIWRLINRLFNHDGTVIEDLDNRNEQE